MTLSVVDLRELMRSPMTRNGCEASQTVKRLVAGKTGDWGTVRGEGATQPLLVPESPPFPPLQMLGFLLVKESLDF